MKGEHVKDAANATFQGAKKVCCGAQRPGCESPPTPALRWHMKDEHVKDAAQNAAEDVPQDVAKDLAFGARAARALLTTPPPPRLCAAHARAEIWAQLSSSVAFGSGYGGQALPGVPRKVPLC